MAHHLDANDYVGGAHPATPRMLRTNSSTRTSNNPSQTDLDQVKRELAEAQPITQFLGHLEPSGSHEAYKEGMSSPAPTVVTNSNYSPAYTPQKKRAELLPPAALPSPNSRQQDPSHHQSPDPHGTTTLGKLQQRYQHGPLSSDPSSIPPAQKLSLGHPSSSGNVQQFHRKSIGDWNFIKTIGAGSMGRVKLAQHNSTGEVCAVKIVPRAAKLYQRAHANEPPVMNPQIAERRQKEFEKEVARDRRTIREAALGRLLFHPYICRLYEMVTMTNHYYMLFEYVEGGQMLDYIVSHGLLKEKNARKFVRGIASALDYCHRNSVVHRDLKIENIMINQKGDIKIIDFGLSNLYSPKNLLKTYCGSLYFAAPELLSAKPYTGPEVDIWLFGVVLYVLVCGKVPFDDKSVSVLHEKIKRGNVEYPEFLLKDCISLLLRMLVVDPLKRATLYEIMHHPWMNRGYESAPLSYLPKRVPLKLPLDPAIIKTIAQFDLGSEAVVASELTNILSSVEYQMLVENWYKLTKQGKDYGLMNIASILPDPTSGYHPLISIYYLVDEMRKRKLLKQQQQQQQLQQQQQQQEQDNITKEPPKRLEERILLQSQELPSLNTPKQQPENHQNSPQQHQQLVPKNTLDPTRDRRAVSYGMESLPGKSEQPQTPILSQGTRNTPETPKKYVQEVESHSPPNPPPVIALSPPEPAHTSGESSTAHAYSAVVPLPEQQPTSPTQESIDAHGKSGFNLLFRKLSGKYARPLARDKTDRLHPGSPEFQFPDQENSLQPHDPMVRRGVSMKITAKEKLSSSRVNLSRKDSATNINSSATLGHQYTSKTGYNPAEELPPLPNINPQEYANYKASNSGKVSNGTGSSNESANYTLSSNYNHVPTNNHLSAHTAHHHTARAKSVGGNTARDQFASYHNSSGSSRPPLPNELAAQNLEEIIDAYFDDVTLDDEDDYNMPRLTEEQIMSQFHHAKPNTMPSIEYPKTLFLKGFFSVQTTSTKPLPIIRYNILSVLSRLGVKFQEVKGGFICLYNGEISPMRELNEEKQLYGDAFKLTLLLIEIRNKDKEHLRAALQSSQYSQVLLNQPARIKTPDLQDAYTQPSGGLHRQTSVLFNSLALASLDYKTHRTSNLIGGGHRRKFLIGQLILTSYRKKNGSQVNMPPNTPATTKVNRLEDDDEDGDTLHVNGDSIDLIGGMGGVGGSDMLDQSRVEQRARQNHQRLSLVQIKKPLPLKFEILVVKVPLVGLYGVQFKKILGNTWNYKTLASEILNDLNL